MTTPAAADRGCASQVHGSQQSYARVRIGAAEEFRLIQGAEPVTCINQARAEAVRPPGRDPTLLIFLILLPPLPG